MATYTTNLSLIKPAGTDKIRIAQINQNMDTIDAAIGAVGNTSLQTQVTGISDSMSAVEGGIAIVSNNNTHVAITSGQYVYVKNHATLSEGLYRATQAIATNGTLTLSNVTPESAGGLNSLNEQIGTLNTNLTQHSIYASSKVDVYTLSPHIGVIYFTGLEITGETNISDVIPSGYRSVGLQRCGVICDGNGDFTCLVSILANGALNLTPNTNNAKSFYGTVLFRF